MGLMTIHKPSQPVAVYDQYQAKWPVKRDEMPKVMDVGFFDGAGIWIRSMSFVMAGESYQGHKHQFDHASFLTKGRVAVRVKDQWREYLAPSFVEIKKDDEHEIVALEPSDWWCVFAVRDEDPLKFAL